MTKTERYLPFILALLVPVVSVVNNNMPLEHVNWLIGLLKYIQSATVILVIWYLNRYLIYSHHFSHNRWIYVSYSVLLNAVLIGVFLLMDVKVGSNAMSDKVGFGVISLRLVIVILIFNTILRVFKTQRERADLREQNLSLQAENLKFEIETLKQQINPHFLFNSLNTLLDLIEEENRDVAVKFVRNFSGLYRVVLQSAKYDFVSLRDELKCLSDYWDLLKVRFHDAIELNIAIQEEKMNYLIPPLSLQFLIENAVKHNEASIRSPLVIEIKENGDCLEVINRIVQKPFPVQSEKVGLKNLQKRFTLLFQPVEYGVIDENFIVKLPLKKA